MTTASQRGRSNRNRGHQAERDLAKWLRTVGFGQAERAVVTGWTVAERRRADPGDITGVPGLVVSVKDTAVEQLDKWWTELADMAAMDDGHEAPLRLLVHKRRGHASPARWWVWLELVDLAWLASPRENIDTHSVALGARVRMELGDLVSLVRLAGYGDPIPSPSMNGQAS